MQVIYKLGWSETMKHCMKSVQIRSFFWSVFSCIQTEYRETLPVFPYSVRMRKNTNQKKLRIWTLFPQWRYRSEAAVLQMIFKVGVLNNLATFAGKHLCFQVCNFRPSILLKRDSNTGVFLWILRIFWVRVFYRTPLLATSNRCKLFLAF